MKKKIVYIAGEGHSGSTLLDIILGSNERVFSAGELINLAQKGIKNGEYCSCGKPVPECDIWQKIINKWNKERILNLDEYLRIQHTLITNKKIVTRLITRTARSAKALKYIKDRELLYDIIFQYTDSDIIVDSSKSPHNIPIIKKTKFKIEVIHLVRRFGDVLNSYKKGYSKNLAKGIEENIKPIKTHYVLIIWLLNNVLSYLYSRNTNYKLIRYEELVTNPASCLTDLISHDETFVQRLHQRGPFFPKHLVAGNRIRMKDQILISKKPMDTSYHRLSKLDRLLARSIDFFY